MLASWSWVLTICFICLRSYCSGDGLVDSWGYIIPEAKVLQLGTQFTASCILKESKMKVMGINASNVYWATKGNEVPRTQCSVKNATVSNVVLNVTASLKSPLTCNIMLPGNLKQTVYGIFFTAGMPPEKPVNLSCVVHHPNNMTCAWNPGRETYLPTNHTLKYKRWSTQDIHECSKPISNNFCVIPYPNYTFFVNTEIWVEATNVLGKSESEHIVLDPADYVKSLPPVITDVSSTRELSNALDLRWKNPLEPPEMKLKYNIRYKRIADTEWTKVPPEDTATHRDSFMLQNLKPFKKYMIEIRCMNENGRGYWSNWSKEKSGVTPEAKPSKKVDLWRIIDPPDSKGTRHVHLMWKELEPDEANGRILGYKVQIQQEDLLVHLNVTGTSLNYNLTRASYVVSVVAFNSAGQSPEATLVIRAASQRELPSVENVVAFPEGDRLWVNWTAPTKLVIGYIIEWYIEPRTDQSNLSWHREPKTAISTYLKGDLSPYKRYVIFVYPLYAAGSGAAKSTESYFKQDSPAIGPTVSVSKVQKTEAVVQWKPVPVEKRNGFIRNYTIFYRSNTGVKSSFVVNSSIEEYILTSLESDTVYIVHVVASTDVGGTKGPEFTFTTLKFARGEIEAIVVPVCLSFLLLSVLAVLICFNKRDLIKKHVWPNVPDPSNSTVGQWSPQSLTKHDFSSKEQTDSESSTVDVSVIKIEASSKSDAEDDLKSSVLKNEKSTSVEHSSGIGGSSCMSSPRQSVSDSEESEPAQTTSSTVQYSTVLVNGYRDQLPQTHTFSRSESTQPLLESEERPDDQHGFGNSDSCSSGTHGHRYFKQKCDLGDANRSGPSNVQKTVPQAINEESLVGLHQLQMIDQNVDSSGFCPLEDGTVPETLQQNGGQTVVSLDLLGFNTRQEGAEPKSYLPQTIKHGGYMPQ
uniref:Interleukin-6 receptor subunit beta n=1 Tax=Latimeria chalumnae TaxID=7897 RepID=H3AKP8_LATCH